MKIVAVIVVLLVVLFAILLVFQNMKVPTHLGHDSGKLAPMPSTPNAVSSQAKQESKKVIPVPYKESSEQTMAAVVKVLEQMGGNDIQTQEGNYVYTIFTTPMMRFHDDVEIFLDDAAQLVHFRSQSRAGKSDLGANRKRYEQFSELYGK
jgi:uncharacterized protein (DUF1499 family)